MADPKIRYDIEANVAGNAEVGKLASQIEKLAGTLDGELKTAALASADALRKLAQKDGAVQNFIDLKRESQQAAAGLKDAQAAAQKLGSELAATVTPTRAQAGQMEKLRDAVRSAKAEVTSKSAAVVQARATLQQYGVSTDNLAQSQRNIKAAIAAARTEVAALAPAWQSAAAGATASAGQQVQATKKIESGLDSLKTQLNTLRNIATAALGGSYLGSLASDVAATADAYNNLQARIKLVTGEGAAFESAFEGVTAVALRTSSSLENTGELFAKLADAGKTMGVGQAEALKLTEAVNQAVQLGGASAQASDAAITQLIQGLQAGEVRGENFNSVMEQSPRLARAMADGLGVSTGELRKMAEAGELGAKVVIKALQGQSDVLAAEFSKLPPTVGRAIENLSSSWTLYVGETDKATGASSAAAGAINALSSNLSTIAGYLIDAGQAAAAFAALRLAQTFLGIGTAATASAAAVAANTVAITAAGAASTTAAAGVGRFAALLGGLKTFSLIGLVTNFHDIGTAIGEAAAKLMGYKDLTVDMAEADKQAALEAQKAAEYRRKVVEATEAARESQLGLNKATKAATLEFDALIAKGHTAAEAIAKIGKDFDLTNSPGIRNAGVLLNNLVATGKLTAEQFRQAWSDALKGINLADFEDKAAKAFGDTTDGVLRLKQALDATLREAIKRTGLDFDVISGGMSKASQSAIDDTNQIIKGLDRLKAMGVDTATALTASLGKSIDTADSQKAIDAVRLQIEAVRKALGDKVADGLLDQAKTKMLELAEAADKAKPGINGLKEAMKELGVVSDQTFKDTAAKSKAAYDEMKNSGTASARELADGFRRYASDAIAANGGVATEALRLEAAMRGASIQATDTGANIVNAMAGSENATNSAAFAARGLTKDYEKAAEAARFKSGIGPSSPEMGEAKLKRKAKSGTLSANDLDLAMGVFDAAQQNANLLESAPYAFSLDGIQNVRNELEFAKTTLATVKKLAGAAGVKPSEGALELAQDKFDAARSNLEALGLAGALAGPSAMSIGQSAVRQAQSRLGEAQREAVNGYNPNATSSAKVYTVNINTGSKQETINTASDADAQKLIRFLQSAKLSAN